MSSGDVYESRKFIVPNSVTASWTVGGTPYSLTDDGQGSLTGDGDGTVHYASGRVVARPNPAPGDSDGGIEWDFSEWSGGTKQTQTETPAGSGATSFTLANAPVAPGSVQIRLQLTRNKTTMATAGASMVSETRDYVVTDDGNGNLRRGGESVGTINYTTGAVSLTDVRASYSYRRRKSISV